jgi:hypothetical protein
MDVSKRISTSSPLARSAKSDVEVSAAPAAKTAPQTETRPSPSSESSPAVQQLSALSEKASTKGVKSRLRRAFSFSSSQELRRATAENNLAAEKARLRKEKYEADNENIDTEDEVIAQQEASGLGAGIYSHQAASTDNISISSTASSASMMLRKMSKGVKKSTRNLKNLFRPKSVIGSPAADGALAGSEVSTAEVSLVTVEAEREKVNVNVDPHDKPGGGTGYPKLERNSLDASYASAFESPSSSPSGPQSRKSIIGGERERAEVLAAVKKGILKREFALFCHICILILSRDWYLVHRIIAFASSRRVADCQHCNWR